MQRLHNLEINSNFALSSSGCSSARLEYASGGRVVGRSNRLTPTGESQRVRLKNLTLLVLNTDGLLTDFRQMDSVF